jgi:hypothetical protein
MLTSQEGLCSVELAVNILNMQLRTADKGGYPTWELGQRLTIPDLTNLTCYEVYQRTSGSVWML